MTLARAPTLVGALAVRPSQPEPSAALPRKRPPLIILLLFGAGGVLLLHSWRYKIEHAPLAAVRSIHSAFELRAQASNTRRQSPSPPPAQLAISSSPPPTAARRGAAKKAERAAAPTSRRLAKRILVGLNRKVYRFVTERDYTCPELRFGGCTFTTERSRFGEADAMIDVLKDARKAKPLDFRRKKGQPVGVIISEQVCNRSVTTAV